MFAIEGQDMDIELCSRRCKEQLISFWGSSFLFSGPKSAPLWSPLQRNTSSRRTSCRRNLAFLYNFAILSHNPALWSPLSCCIYVVCTKLPPRPPPKIAHVCPSSMYPPVSACISRRPHLPQLRDMVFVSCTFSFCKRDEIFITYQRSMIISVLFWQNLDLGLG